MHGNGVFLTLVDIMVSLMIADGNMVTKNCWVCCCMASMPILCDDVLIIPCCHSNRYVSVVWLKCD